MPTKLPELRFEICERRQKHPWLQKKKEYLDRKWTSRGTSLLKRITRICGLEFPPKVRDSAIEVRLEAYSRKKHESYCGWMTPNHPYTIFLSIKKKDTYRTIESTLCHELIHCLMCARQDFDNRRRSTTLFEDFFADELLATLLQELAIKRTARKVDVGWALDYAFSETQKNLRNLKRRRESYAKLRKALMDELITYNRSVLRKQSDIFVERRKIITAIPSPLANASAHSVSY